MRYTLCDTFIKSSGWIWSSLRQARKFDLQLKEESVTDFLIINLRRWKPSDVYIKTFTRSEEVTTGSDWEWWFTGPSGKWLGMRIQAKVIKLSTSRYEHLDYKRGAQREQLIKDAKKHKMIPAYCLYTNWPAHEHKILKKQSKRATFRRTVYGAALLSVDDAATLQTSNYKSLEQAMPYLRPLQELFCQEPSQIEELPNLIYHNLLWIGIFQPSTKPENPNRSTEQAILDTLDDRSTERDRFRNTEDGFVQNDAPAYVYQLAEAQPQPTQLRGLDDNNLNRVTIFQQR